MADLQDIVDRLTVVCEGGKTYTLAEVMAMIAGFLPAPVQIRETVLDLIVQRNLYVPGTAIFGSVISSPAFGETLLAWRASDGNIASFRALGSGTYNPLLFIQADEAAGQIGLESTGSNHTGFFVKTGGTKKLILDTSGNLWIARDLSVSGNMYATSYNVDNGTLHTGIDHTEIINGKTFTWAKGILVGVS